MRKSHSLSQSVPKDRAKRAKAEGKTGLARDLVDWYRRGHRRLPWRSAPGTCQDPYRAWLAEIMLQQTTVVTVKDYYLKFLRLWPNVRALAKATEDDVLREWAGLGYYSRARNLHACARTVVSRHKGKFPTTLQGLIDLPGIGPYTAAAVASMAFGERRVPVDGNVERVMARLYALGDPPAKIKAAIQKLAQEGLDAAPDVFPGDYAQALMDLGATVCTPKSPKCDICPVAACCAARIQGNPGDYPVVLPKGQKLKRFGTVFIILNKKGQILIEKRPDKGLLGGMMALPTTEWQGKPSKKEFPPINDVLRHIGQIRHSFTHFDLELQVVMDTVARKPPAFTKGQWTKIEDARNIGFPRVFEKAFDLYLDFIE